MYIIKSYNQKKQMCTKHIKIAQTNKEKYNYQEKKTPTQRKLIQSDSPP